MKAEWKGSTNGLWLWMSPLGEHGVEVTKLHLAQTFEPGSPRRLQPSATKN